MLLEDMWFKYQQKKHYHIINLSPEKLIIVDLIMSI